MSAHPPALTPRLFSAAEHGMFAPFFAAMLNACLGSVGPFVPPLADSGQLLQWTKDCFADAADGRRVLLLLLNEAAPPDGRHLRGLAMARLPAAQKADFRAEIDAIIVQPDARRRGCARLLLAALEAEAVRRGRTLLVVNAGTGSDGEAVLKKLGYVEAGRIPDYSRVSDRERRSETFLYKKLSHQTPSHS